MLRLLRWRGRDIPGGGSSGERVLRLEGELQRARLEVARLEELAGRLRDDLARTRASAETGAGTRADEEVRKLVAAIGTPLVQLVTQGHLHRAGTVALSADEVLGVGSRLVAALGAAGVETVGEIGVTEPFDPARHDPLGAGRALAGGQPAVVRMAGLAYRGQVVRKAGVE